MKIQDVPRLDIDCGVLTMDGVDLVSLAREYGTPLYVGSEKRIEENVNEVISSFRKYHQNTTVHYAAKAETSIATLQIVKNASGSLEVNSGGELYKGLHAGFSGSEIVFNGVAKSEKEIEMAVECGVKSINVDSLFELTRIAGIAHKLGKRANVILRIVPDVASNVAKGVETGTHECKFGTMLDEVPDMIVFALKNSDDINLKGYHFHIGTQTYNLQTFVDSFGVLLDFSKDMERKLDYRPEILDIGGGLPIPYFIDSTASQYMAPNLYLMLRGVLTTEEIAKAVVDKLHEYGDMYTGCELILEPGRKIVGDAFTMISRVENKKTRKQTAEDWIMLDAGLNVMSEVKTYHWYFPMVCANKISEPHIKPYKIAGPLCESGDVWMDYDTHKDLPDYRLMPESIDVGDYVAMLETGAYGTSMMNRYNGRPMAGTVIIRKDGSTFVARKPEEYSDLLVGESDLV